MNKKIINFANWLISITLCGLGICLCTKASFGLSMIAAPPYIIHCFMCEALPWFTQGTAEYFWEAVILVVLCIIIRSFKPKFLLSFVTAIISGLIIDFWLWVFGGSETYESFPIRIIAFVVGCAIISIAIAFVFRTTMPPQVYELVVNGISDKFGFDKSKTKLGFDITMLIITVLLSRILTHAWTGVGIGTVIVTFANAPMIKFFGKIIDKIEKLPES